MTKLLQRAISEIQKLPETEQDVMASIILDEIADEERWAETFARSQDKLSRMADKVRESNRLRSHD
ncbi:MAG: hypothetical protein JF614_04495 [Acidobacteria bacterium]|nr:hypothetical protein [Acidobacteriota bacterium]